jgi:hypothetical protein
MPRCAREAAAANVNSRLLGGCRVTPDGFPELCPGGSGTGGATCRGARGCGARCVVGHADRGWRGVREVDRVLAGKMPCGGGLLVAQFRRLGLGAGRGGARPRAPQARSGDARRGRAAPRIPAVSRDRSLALARRGGRHGNRGGGPGHRRGNAAHDRTACASSQASTQAGPRCARVAPPSHCDGGRCHGPFRGGAGDVALLAVSRRCAGTDERRSPAVPEPERQRRSGLLFGRSRGGVARDARAQRGAAGDGAGVFPAIPRAQAGRGNDRRQAGC